MELGYKNRHYDTTPGVSKERWAEIKEKFPHFPEIEDFTATRKEALFRLPPSIEDWVVKTFLRDKRDAIMASTILNIVFINVPLTIAFWYRPTHWLGIAIYVQKLVLWLQRFILMMHYSEHRRLFKDPYHSLGRHLLNFVIAPFMGIPPGFYRLHHVVMHHVENNFFEGDLSSTEMYQRDNFLHFLHYVAKYFACVVFLPLWAYQKDYYDMFGKCLMGGAVWFGCMAASWMHSPIFCLWTWIVPFVSLGFIMMFGNFSQHIFIQPEIATMKQDFKSVEYNCALTIQCMNHFDNQYSFNDGYHVTHHIKSRCHWTDMPKEFLDNLEEYAKHNVICFTGLGFFDVGLHVMLGWWDKIYYEHYVHLTKEKRPREEVIAWLKSCLKPIEPRKETKVSKKEN